MRRYRGLFRLSGAFSRYPFSADYTISMLGFDFCLYALLLNGFLSACCSFIAFMPGARVRLRLPAPVRQPLGIDANRCSTSWLSSNVQAGSALPWETIPNHHLSRH